MYCIKSGEYVGSLGLAINVLSTREMNTYGLKDREGTGSVILWDWKTLLLSLCCTVVSLLQTSDMFGTIRRTLNHDDTTESNNMLIDRLTPDQIKGQASRAAAQGTNL
jgi:hypothetical protein